MAKLTVFTSTYNRGNLLENLYQSLKSQSCFDFEWLIIDDGSSDQTRSIVTEWIQNENRFTIRYIYQENGGLSKGYNTAIEHLHTELAMCIDSDDRVGVNAVETILDLWKEVKSSDCAGLIGLDVDPEGRIIGHEFINTGYINPVTLMPDRKIGDKKYVFETVKLREAWPIPIIENEKNLNPHYLVLILSRKYKFYAVNSPFCVVDYQENGMSSNMWIQYRNSPRSFILWRKLLLSDHNLPLSYRFKNAIHLQSSCFLADVSAGKQSGTDSLLVTAAAIPGWLLSRVVLHKCKENRNDS